MQIISILALANAVLLLLTAVVLLKKNDTATIESYDEIFADLLVRNAEALARLKDLLTRLDELSAEVARLSLAEHRSAPNERGQSNYAAAIHLAQSGCSVPEIMQSCGLPRAEARLVKHWQTIKESPPPADSH